MILLLLNVVVKQLNREKKSAEDNEQGTEAA